MAMGIPAQPGPLMPSFSSHPRLLSSPLCGTAWMLRRPFRRWNRQEFRSLQRLGANNSGINSYGSLKAIQPSGMTTRSAVMSGGMHIIHHARFCSSQSSYPKLVSTFNLINMPRTEEESKPNFGVSGWVQETVKFQISRTTHQLRRNIAKGLIPLQVLEHNYILEKEKVDFGVVLDRSAYEGEVSTYPHELLVNKITKPQPVRHNLATNTHRQSELTTTQSVREDIHPKGSRSLKPLGDLKITANDTSFSNSTINDHCIRSSIEKTAPPKECSKFVGASQDTIIANDTNFSNFSINGHCIKSSIEKTSTLEECGLHKVEKQEKLVRIYDKVLVVDNPSTAKEVVQVLTTTYKNSIHACDTEVANIDVKQETPVGHGEIICFSIYSGPQTDFGNGKSCIWVDVLDGGRDVLMEFAPFFKDPSIKKVWHNYSFDSHVIENYGIKLSGFHADTMHLARLWDSSRRTGGGYSLEALTSDPRLMAPNRKNNQRGMPRTQSCPDDEVISGKMSMKSIFGKNKVKKDGSEGKLVTVAPVEMLQRGEERIQWICYSASDSINTWKLFNRLKENIMTKDWVLDGVSRGTMYDFYEEYWRPFGVLLVKMESEGMLVDRAHLSGIEKVAIAEQQLVADRFRKWASKYCPDAKYMNVGSDTQLRQLFFGGIQNRKDINETLPDSKTFKVPNIENVSENGMKTSSKYRTITLNTLGVKMQTEIYTPSGWPSVSGDALKAFAGKLSTDQIFLMDYENGFHSGCSKETLSDQTDLEKDESEKLNASADDTDTSTYGTAYLSFGGGKEGKEACLAIAALCEVCSIDSLISNFILPLQGNHISGKNGRVHCSLNINTETGRLSARRPNLQNQPALEKDRYKIRQAFIAEPGNSLIVADYGQLELRILAHLSSCKSMLDAFKAGGDFHSRTAMNMYSHVREAVEGKRVLLEWHPQPGEDKPPVPLLKDAFAAERRKAKMLNFSIAYGKTPVGLSRDWKVTVKEAKETVKLWYKNREEVLEWQETRKIEAREKQRVYTLLGRARDFPSMTSVSNAQKGHIERAAINAPVQGSAADVAMCAMLEIDRNTRLKDLGWKLLLQVHDEVILEGPSESAEIAKALVVECMSKPFYGTNFLKVDLSVDAKCAQNWYAAK